MKRRLLARLLVALAVCAAARARAETIVEDQDTYRKLLASKVCTVQWVDTPAKGVVTVGGDAKSTLKLGCEHVSADGLAYVKMSGGVVKVAAKKFVFKGVILVKQATDFDAKTMENKPGLECRREGTFTFSQRGKRRYWRLQDPDMLNPCNGTTDYVDVWLPAER